MVHAGEGRELGGGRIIFTVGHSTRSLPELVELLRDGRVQAVVDVRRFPASRKNPQFARENLEAGLRAEGLGYFWLGEELGGFRTGGYLAYSLTQPFRSGLARLEELGASRRVAVLCAERLWFRCHRRFIAEALARRGWRVIHLVEKGKSYPHRIPPSGEGG